MQTTTTRDSEVVSAARAGVTAIAPLVIGFAPFALVVGATIGAASNHEAGIAGSWLIYGGSAQIATVRALETGGALTAILAALLINTRLLVYSASLSQHWRDQPLWFRVTAAPMIVDPVWAVAEAALSSPARHARSARTTSVRRSPCSWRGAGSSSQASCSAAGSTVTRSVSRRRCACCSS